MALGRVNVVAKMLGDLKQEYADRKIHTEIHSQPLYGEGARHLVPTTNVGIYHQETDY